MSQRRSCAVYLPGGCYLGCLLCERALPMSQLDAELHPMVGGGDRVVLRGGTHNESLLTKATERARAEGFSSIVVRTHGIEFLESRSVASLIKLGVTAVVVPLFSQHSHVHDRIARRPGVLVNSLVAMRKIAEAGLRVEIEVPLLRNEIQSPAAVLELACRAVATVRAARFFVPAEELPLMLSLPRWGETAASLMAAMTVAQKHNVRVVFEENDGIPFCAFHDHPERFEAFRFSPRGRIRRLEGASLVEGCSNCSARQQCSGLSASYVRDHGDKDVVPFEAKPRRLYEQRSTQRAEWTEARRQSASKAGMLVLRPTVNCNQDCTFCSANETSRNNWTDPGKMLRTIARAAKRGVQRVSFSGGEPTLSRHLVSFVEVARRLGIPAVEIVTNGVLLDSSARVNALKEAGLNFAFVSLHTHDEQVSRRLTQKVGDHARSINAIKLLLDAGIAVGLNCVITSENYRYLTEYVEFVHEQFGGRAFISFAFVTPQYKALENIDMMPRYSDMMPSLRAAMYKAKELKQNFLIGSRQGIPSCFLKEFQGWSDLFRVQHEGRSEDAPQKVHGTACERCTHVNVCLGLRRSYVERYGFDELEPIEGPPFTPEELTAFSTLPWPSAFDEVTARLRMQEHESTFEALRQRPAMLPRHLPVFVAKRSRPLRLAMLGTGRRARYFASAVSRMNEVTIEAVASPRAHTTALGDFGYCSMFTDSEQALDECRPEAVVVTAATHAHDALTRAAIARNLPVLVEKPLAKTLDEARALVEHIAACGALVMPAHNVLFASGVDGFFDVCDPVKGARKISYVRRCTPQSSDSPPSWGRDGVYQTLYHALVLVGRAMGGGEGEVRSVSFKGEHAPQSIRLSLSYAQGEADLVFEFRDVVDDISLALFADGKEALWRRSQTKVTLLVDGETVPNPGGNEIERMLSHFHDVVVNGAEPKVKPIDALEVMQTGVAVIQALDSIDAPFDRPNAPKHVASRNL